MTRRRGRRHRYDDDFVMSQAATHLAAGLGFTQAVSGQGCLGLLLLDTQFPRPAGDLGLAASYPVPVLRVVVHGAWPAKVVGSKAGLRKAALVEGFKRAVIQLQRQGAWAITTSCGFLVLLQKELQGVATVPVETSSLLQLPRLLAEQAQVGVLTISSAALSEEYLRSAGVPRERLADVVVQGVPAQSEFASAILNNRAEMDIDRARADVVAAAVALKARAPGLTTVVLECTNMPPYAQAITQATGLRAVSLLDSVRLFKPFA